MICGKVENKGEEGATEDVAESDGDEVREEGEEIPFAGGEKAGGDVEHVGDAVLETAHHEESDGKNAGKEFAGEGLGGEGHIDGQTDEDVAENTEDEGFTKVERDFCGGDGGKRSSNEAGVGAKNAAKGH